jgi:diphthamide synthase (EF-2-diphthine--ammonia ligase)
VAARQPLLADEFCGRRYDALFLKDLPVGVDACGENGEFHTFVFNGPMFRQPVPCRVGSFEDYTAPVSLGGVRYRFAQLA